MKTRLAIVIVAVVLVTVSTLAVMNNACKSGQHAWCAPKSTVERHIKPGHGYFPNESNRLAVLFLRSALI
jgi:hypothetical protein